MLFDRVLHASVLTTPELPSPRREPESRGPHAVQVLRTYPARLRRYPFAPQGERSIAHAYQKSLRRLRRLIYVEDQYLSAPEVAKLLVAALQASPELRLVVVVPRYPDKEGRARWPSLVGRERTVAVCRAAGPDRFAIYDVENRAGMPVYVIATQLVHSTRTTPRGARGTRKGRARRLPVGGPLPRRREPDAWEDGLRNIRTGASHS